MSKTSGDEERGPSGQSDALPADTAETIQEMTLCARGKQLQVKKSVVLKIPYFQTLLSDRWNDVASSGEPIVVDLNPKLLHPCLAYVESECKMPSLLLTKLSRTESGSDVADLARFLCLDIPTIHGDAELKDLEKSLRDTKEETIKIARRCYETITPNRCGARDAAAMLYFSIVAGTMGIHGHKMEQKFSTNVLYIVSHARTFGPRLRSHVWKLFDGMVTLTAKQESVFQKWVSSDALSFDFYRDEDSDSDGDSKTDGSKSSVEDWGDYEDDYW